MDKKFQDIEDILIKMNEKYLSTESFLEFFAIFTDLLKEVRDDVNNQGTEFKESTSSLVDSKLLEIETKNKNNWDEIFAKAESLKNGTDGKDGDTPSDEKLVSLIKPLIPVPESGKTPTKEELVKIITPLIPVAIDGKDGKNAEFPNLEEWTINTVNYMETLDEEDKLSMSAVKDLEETISNLKSRTQLLVQAGSRSSGSSGVTKFTALTDAPNSYSGQSGKVLAVNGAETSLEFITVGGTGTVTSVASADGSITVTNPTTTPDLAVVKSPKLTTGRTISTTGDVTYTSGAFDGQANVTGTATIANSAVTLAKQADVATSTVFYRKTAGTGVPEVNTLATLKTDLLLTGTNSGDQTTIVGITGTKVQFDTAVTDGNIFYVGDTLTSASVTDFVEAAQDATGAMVDATLVYVDGTPLLTRGAISGDVTIAQASNTALVTKINNVALSGLATGVLKNTTGTGVPSIAVAATDYVAPGAVTTDGITMSTSRLLGRSTAGTGAIEEITLGTNLSFTGTTLNAASGGAGTFAVTETELDFGAVGTTPVTEATFTVTDAAITSSSKIMCTQSGNTATGQGTGDMLWDSIDYAALPGTGSFTVYAKASGWIIGKRKMFYTYS